MTPFDEKDPEFSPDGRWLAYASKESGRYEVYVQPYPGREKRWIISTDGGTAPVWSADGHELFYRDLTGRKMMAVSFRSEPTVQMGKPRLLFDQEFLPDGDVTGRQYDLAPDGQRFLMVRADEGSGLRQLNIVLNWFEELKRLVPAEN